MTTARTVTDLLERGEGSAVAMAAPGRRSLTYSGLRRHVANMVTTLNSLGIGRNDTVAIVLPNGPEMASAFVAIAAGATTAPLNPAYGAKELEFYLSDLNAKLLVVDACSATPARRVAKSLGIAVADLRWSTSDAAGLFELVGDPAADEPQAGSYAGDDDVALVLHTSGTTSRPKLVPLSQRNVCTSAQNVGESIALAPGDRCLSIMPLFHIHGLIAAVLASLNTGASVYCTPGFNALKFFGWLREADPTWYTAVPTMHQAILGRASRNREIIEGSRLRLIRSSSASLPPRVMQALEDTFETPVIEAYGMTEAAHQMASNPCHLGCANRGR